MIRTTLLVLMLCLLCSMSANADYYAVLIVGEPPDTRENDLFQTTPDTIIYHHEECFYHLVNAVRLQTITGGTPPDTAHPDANSDGITSLMEIWEWVDARESYDPENENQHPQYADSGTIGSSTFLNIPPYATTGLNGTIVDCLAVLYWNRNKEYDFDHYEIHRKTYDHTTQLYSFWGLLAT
ncbi:MAG: hypothetical protein ABH878_04530, partial [bacterium]